MGGGPIRLAPCDASAAGLPRQEPCSRHKAKAILHLATVVLSHARISDLGEQGFEPRLEGGAPLRRVGRVRPEFPLPQHIDERPGAGKTLAKRVRALSPPQGRRGPSPRAGRRSGTTRPSRKFGNMRSMTRAAAASRPDRRRNNDGLRRKLPQQFHVTLREGSAERGDGVRRSPRDQRGSASIAFRPRSARPVESAFPRARN